MNKIDILTDVNSDQQQGGLLADINIDRPTVARLGLTLNAIDNTLYDAFGQRQVSTIYAALNQYHVVMEVAPRYWQDPATLKDLWVSTSGANPSGTQSTNATAGDFSASAATASAAARIAADSARNLAINSIAATGHSSASAGARSRPHGIDDSVGRLRQFRRPYAAGVDHQGQFVTTRFRSICRPVRHSATRRQAIANAIVDIGCPRRCAAHLRARR